MRALILVAGAALAVTACSSNDAADNTMNLDDNMVMEDTTMDANAMDMNADANMTMNMDENGMDANAAMDANTTTNAM